MNPFDIALALAYIMSLVFAILSMIQRDLVALTVFFGLHGATVALVYLMLRAPDIALAQASVGTAINTLLLIALVRRTSRFEEEMEYES